MCRGGGDGDEFTAYFVEALPFDVVAGSFNTESESHDFQYADLTPEEQMIASELMDLLEADPLQADPLEADPLEADLLQAN